MAGGAAHMQSGFNSIKLENPGYYCNSYTPPGPADHHAAAAAAMLPASGYSKLLLCLVLTYIGGKSGNTMVLFLKHNYLFIFFIYNIILNIYEEYHQFELEFKSASSKSSHVRPFSSAALYLALYSISIKYKVSKCDGS